MAALTEEEKEKIIEEERIRADERAKHTVPQQIDKPACQLCGAPMKKRYETKTALALLLIGIGIVCCLFIVGAIIGIPLIIIGLYYGSVRKGLWVCTACGHKVERKLNWRGV